MFCIRALAESRGYAQSLQEQDDVFAETISRMREDRGRGGVFDEMAFGDYVDIFGPKIQFRRVVSDTVN